MEPLPFSSLFKKKTQQDDGVMEEGNENDRRPLSLRAMLVPGIIIAAFNLSSIYLLLTFYLETEVLYLSTPISNGGLGLSSRAIGTFSSIAAAVKGISQLFVFPRMHDKWGSRFVFVLGLSATVPQFMLWPLMNWIARRDGYSGLVWFALAAQTCCAVLNELGWRKSCTMLIKSRYKCGCSFHFSFYCPIVWKPCGGSRLLRGMLPDSSVKYCKLIAGNRP